MKLTAGAVGSKVEESFGEGAEVLDDGNNFANRLAQAPLGFPIRLHTFLAFS